MSIFKILGGVLGLLGIGSLLAWLNKKLDLRKLLAQKVQQGKDTQKLKEAKDAHQASDARADQTKQSITQSTQDLNDADDIADEFRKHYSQRGNRQGPRPDRLN